MERTKLPASTPAFLNKSQREAGAKEWKALTQAPLWGATYLTRRTLDWAQKHPDDVRVPEALHRTILAGRYRSTDAQTAKYEKQAFDLLHRRYPKSPWTARTRYWYDWHW